ncbi:hypothetical protein JW960_03235 [candidate division KSB1 bacterium]|nr:hypothetical protein [candidate division KSB1 bacterium]
MGGQASLIMVMGFAYLFSIYQLKTGNVTTNAVENYVEYYSRTVSHEIAMSGMNIAAAKVYEDSSYSTNLSVDYQGGNLTVVFGTAGDTLEVKSIGTYNGHSDTVIAYFGFTSTGGNMYLEFTMFTAMENGCAWIPGDQVWGPVHTNGIINHQNKNTIIFNDKVTAGKGIASPPKSAKTQFLGGYEVGVFLPEITSMGTIKTDATSGGYNFPTPSDTLKLQFESNGNVVVYRNSAALYPDPGVALTTLAPNGVIYSDGPVEILGGVVNTNAAGVTVGTATDIILRDEFVYADDPESNPASDDFLGVVANNNMIFDNTTKIDWKIQSALMAINGSMVAVDMNKGGTFNYYGSIYQSSRGTAKMFHSFNKLYKHDERFNGRTLPSFPGPGTGNPKPRLLSWWE